MGDSSDNLAGARKLQLSEEEIQKVKEEYEEKQKRRKEKEKQAVDDAAKKESKEEEKEKEKEKGKTTEKDKSSTTGTQRPSQSPPSSSATPTPPTHQRYTLHREIFAMRLDVHRKRRLNAQAREVAPRLPSAPRAPVLSASAPRS